MTNSQKDLEDLLAVGTTILMQVDPGNKNSPRFKSILRGWCKGSLLWLDRPRRADGVFVPLTEGQGCIVRLVTQGRACAFTTQILDWDTRDLNPAVRLSWPMEFTARNFRRHERIKASLPCRVEDHDVSDDAAQIKDLSVAGCGIMSKKEFAKDCVVSLQFELPDGSNIKDLKAIVRSAAKTGGAWFLGCEFAPQQPSAENDVAYFVTTTLERCHLETAFLHAHRRILLIDDDLDAATVLRNALDRNGFQVIQAGNLVDGMYRLRMTPPAAIAVSQDLKDINGMEFCRLVKRAPGFESLPVYVYGGEGRNFPKAAKEVGAAAYFARGPMMANDLVSEISERLAGSQHKAYRAALRTT